MYVFELLGYISSVEKKLWFWIGKDMIGDFMWFNGVVLDDF